MINKLLTCATNFKSFIYEGSNSIYELLLKTLEKQDEVIDGVNDLEETISVINTNTNKRIDNEVKVLNQKLDNNYKTLDTKMDNNYKTLDGLKENSENITSKRKLSHNGDFTGTIYNRESFSLVTEIDDSRNKIGFLTQQFTDGQTGMVVDGGFFTDEGIRKNYDGGVF